MKKVYKLLFVIMSLFIFLPFVYANNPCTEENLQRLFKEKGITNENDQIALRENCKYQNNEKTDKDYGGCTRSNSSAQNAYSKSGDSTVNWTVQQNSTAYSVEIKVSDIPVTSSWYVVGVKNSKVEGIYYAGCFQGYLKKVKKFGRIKYELVSENDHSVSDKRVYYVKVLEPNNNGTCDLKPYGGGDVFIPAGIKLEYTEQDDHGVSETLSFTTNGVQRSTGYGFQKYDFNGCPEYFYLTTSYPGWWPDSRSNRYIFSDSLEIAPNPSWIGKLLGTDDSGSTAGTSETDTEELNRITKCYDNIATSIVPKYTCTELNSFADKIYNEQKSCNNNHSNFFRDVDENIQTQMLQKIVTALNNKASNIVSCQFSTCNVVNGSLVNKVNESSLPSCLKSCVSELKISDTLEGNTYTNNCAACYRKFYNELQSNNSITAEQKSCLDKQVDEYNKQLNKLQSNFADTVDEDMDQATEDHAESTASSTTTYTKWDIPEIQGGAFGRGGTCTEILGGTNGNGVKILNGIITTIRILAPIVAIINAMILLIPAVTSKDADGLKKASSKCVKIAIILAIVEIFPSVIKLIGVLFGWDTCGIK